LHDVEVKLSFFIRSKRVFFGLLEKLFNVQLLLWFFNNFKIKILLP
jgi:hypothetical protein